MLLTITKLTLVLGTSTRGSGECCITGPNALIRLVARTRTGRVARLALRNGLGTMSFERLQSRFGGLRLLSVSGTSVDVCTNGGKACPGHFCMCPTGYVPTCTFYGRVSSDAFMNGRALAEVVLSSGAGGVRSTTFGKYGGLGVYRVQGGATPGLLSRTLTSDIATVFIPLKYDSSCHAGGG